MGHAMMFIYGREADLAYPHFFRSYRPIVRITARHDLLELIVVLSGHDPGRRGRYEVRGIQRCDLIHVYVAAEGPFEKAFVSLEELPYAGLHDSSPSAAMICRDRKPKRPGRKFPN